MLSTLSVSLFSFEETISTCKFAQRVALIKNDLKLVSEKDITSENTLLRLENERLKQQIEALTKQNVKTSRELTIEEKQTLDSQIRKFVECSATISWDYDPRKIQYCFDAIKKNFALIKNPDSCLEKLKYYKDMVIQRDKEIFLINMLKKERSKNGDFSKSNEQINDNDGNSSDDLKTSSMQCVSSNANIHDDIFNMEFQDNNVKSTPKPIMDSNNHLHAKLHDPSNEIVLEKSGSENEDNTFMFSNVLNDEEEYNVHGLEPEGKYPCRNVAQNIDGSNVKYFVTQIKKEIERNRTNCNNVSNARPTGDIETESEFKNYSSCNRNRHSSVNSMNKSTGQWTANETLKKKATCKIVNVILDETIKNDIQINKCLQVNKIPHRPSPKDQKKQNKYEHIRQLLEDDSGNNTQDTANSREQKRNAEIINTVTHNTAAQSLEEKGLFQKYDLKRAIDVYSTDTPHNFQRFMNFNVPKTIPKSSEIKLCNSECTNLTGKTSSEVRYYDPIGNDSIEDDILQSNSIFSTEKINNAFTMKTQFIKTKKNTPYVDLFRGTPNCSIQEEKSTLLTNLTRKKLEIRNAGRETELENSNKVCFNKDKNNENGRQREIYEGQSLNSMPADSLLSFNENGCYIKTKEIVPYKTSEENQTYYYLNDEINCQAKRKNKMSTNFQQTIELSNQNKFPDEINLNKTECNSARDFHVLSKQKNNQSSSSIKEIKTFSLLECSYEINSRSAGVKPEKEFLNGNEALNEDIQSFEKTLPLTGDPEIDEEIIAFYRAKRSGGIY